jgi:hypothetical protein
LRLWLLACLALAGCAKALPPAGFADAGPAFNPVAFFTGHVTSWGVEENRAGQPTAIVTTDCVGTPDGADSIRMVQVLHVGGGAAQTRIWHFTRTGPSAYLGTANDMAGTALGTAAGPAFHWRWVLETHPRDPLLNVTMDQWMYRMADGDVVIRTTVSKFGLSLLRITEQFDRQN